LDLVGGTEAYLAQIFLDSRTTRLCVPGCGRRLKIVARAFHFLPESEIRYAQRQINSNLAFYG
jgi:hypothetical protein